MIRAPRYPPRLTIPLWLCWSISKTAKRFFRVTAKGIAAVSRTHRTLESMTEGLGFIRSYS
jgi:hypothetical protein